MALKKLWKFTFSLLALLFTTNLSQAQTVEVTISYDTVYAGNILAVRYSMENWKGEPEQPDFGEFELAGGPRMTSSMSYSGGKRSSSKSIQYLLNPPEQEGVYSLPSLTFREGDKEFTTPVMMITVLDNPDGIHQNPLIENDARPAFIKPDTSPPRGKRQRF